MNIVKIMSFVLLIFFMGANAQDQDLLKAAPELIESQAEHADLYHYDKKKVFAPAHGKVIERSVSDVTVNHWFTTGSTRTKITIEPYQDDQIKTTTETWTTKNHSYATYSTAGAGIAALVATWLGLKEFKTYQNFKRNQNILKEPLSSAKIGFSGSEITKNCKFYAYKQKLYVPVDFDINTFMRSNYTDNEINDGKPCNYTFSDNGCRLPFGMSFSECTYSDGKEHQCFLDENQNPTEVKELTQREINSISYWDYR